MALVGQFAVSEIMHSIYRVSEDLLLMLIHLCIGIFRLVLRYEFGVFFFQLLLCNEINQHSNTKSGNNCQHVINFGISAAAMGESYLNDKEIEEGRFEIVYESAEQWLSDRWRKALQFGALHQTKVLVVD